MNVDSIRKYCLSFPDAKENLQWGDDLCFKVNKKIFTVLNLGSVPQGVCFKCTPEKFNELCEYEGIGPAPYVGRYKWVYVEKLNALPDSDLRDLILQSYEIVASKNQRKTNPKKTKIRSRRRDKQS